MIKVSVLIPTFRRPESFARAARSVFAQKGVANVELIAVDNSPEGSALVMFSELSKVAPIPFRWTHAPHPGVSSARNAALALAQGELIAWLDDDEEAAPGWLAALVAVRHETGAQSVFGPVQAQAGAGTVNAHFYEKLYTRTGPRQNCIVAKPYGMGNSLQPRRMFEDGAPFNSSANQRGGEDDTLFATWAEAGAQFAWAADALVVEHLGAERTHLRHGIKRAFAYGQGPSETAWARRDYTSLLRHTFVGLVQMLAFGAAGVVLTPLSARHGLELIGRAAQGAGKVFWFCEQRFYGAALIDQTARRNTRSISAADASAPA